MISLRVDWDKGKGKGKRGFVVPRREHTFKALTYGTRSQVISQFYLHIPHTPANGMIKPYLPLPSKPKLVLIYRPLRDGRLSWPGWLVTYRDKCPAPRTEPGHGHPSQY